jgi:hypothetical protein
MDQLSVQYEWFEEGYASDGSRPMHSCFFLLLTHHKIRSRRTDHGYIVAEEEAQGNPDIDSSLYVDIGYVYGLILEVVDLEKSIYRRIGAFKHMWGDGRTDVDNPKPEDYPEFLDFDPDNFERHTVTII